MKAYIQQLLVIGLFVATLLAGCTTDYPTFDTGQKAGLYSEQRMGGIDSMYFTSKVTDDMIIQSRYFKLMGMTTEYDREIAVEILKTNLSENQYRIGKHVLKANEVRATLDIEFYNSEALKDSTVYVYFRVVDNEHFNVMRSMTPDFYMINEVKSQGKPIWWEDNTLGPFSLGLYGKMVSTFVSLGEINPNLYATMGNDLGYRLEKEPSMMINVGSWFLPIWKTVYSGEMWGKYNQPMLKYVVIPLYEYYQEYPEDGVKIPEPALIE